MEEEDTSDDGDFVGATIIGGEPDIWYSEEDRALNIWDHLYPAMACIPFRLTPEEEKERQYTIEKIHRQMKVYTEVFGDIVAGEDGSIFVVPKGS